MKCYQCKQETPDAKCNEYFTYDGKHHDKPRIYCDNCCQENREKEERNKLLGEILEEIYFLESKITMDLDRKKREFLRRMSVIKIIKSRMEE